MAIKTDREKLYLLWWKRCLQCFDAVSWAAGIAFSLYKSDFWHAGLTDLYILVITTYVSIISCCSKLQSGLTFRYHLTQIVLECWALSEYSSVPFKRFILHSIMWAYISVLCCSILWGGGLRIWVLVLSLPSFVLTIIQSVHERHSLKSSLPLLIHNEYRVKGHSCNALLKCDRC